MTTTGTAGAGWRVEPLPCVWEAETTTDPGQRPLCRWCGREKAAHVVPRQRSGR